MSKCLPLTRNDYYINKPECKKSWSHYCSFVTVTVLLVATWIVLPLVYLAVRDSGYSFFRQSNCSGKALNTTRVPLLPVSNLTTSPTDSSLPYSIVGQDNVTVLSRGFKFFENEQPKTVGFDYLLPSHTIRSVNGTDLFVRNVEFGTKRNMEQILLEKKSQLYTFYYKIFGADSAEGSMREDSQSTYEVVNNTILRLDHQNEVETVLKMEVSSSTEGPWNEIEMSRKYTLVPDTDFLKEMVEKFL